MTREVSEIDRHVGRRIRMRRQEMHWTQSETGARLGVTFQQVQKYERGSNRVSAGNLARIAEALEVPISYFFDDAPDVKAIRRAAPSAMDDFRQTREGVAIAESFARIRDPNKRQALARVIGEIIDTFQPTRRLQAAE